MRRKIEKIAVLGSGIMGSRIACHFANVGIQVLLLDIVPKELTEEEKQKGLDLSHPQVRNRIVNESLKNALKSNPSPIYHQSFANRITTGNFEDDFDKISECDWVLEAVVERLDIKQQIFEKVEKFIRKDAIISTNTSGIPIHMLIEGRSENFAKNFVGTHFFNPPRYLKLLEIIPSPKTDPDIIEFLKHFGSKILGKKVVICKDTPAFIANRIGVFGIQSIFHMINDLGLTIEEVDKLTGQILGRPKSATFRTADVVGLDTLVHVANGLKQNCPNDEANHLFEIPAYVKKMIENNQLGNKTKQGFYKKVKKENGESEILALDLQTGEYRPMKKVKFASLETAKAIDNLQQRIKFLFESQDKAGEFYRKSFLSLFEYVSKRIPEIADEIYKIDEALKAGFGWSLGPFETWDAIGLKNVVEKMKEAGIKPAAWVETMLSEGFDHFYEIRDGKKYYYDINSKSFLPVPGYEDILVMSYLKETNTLWKNSGTTLVDLGDGILGLEFHTKMNAIGGDVLQGIQYALDVAEKDYKGLVIYNEGENFSAGANVGMIFMLAAEQEYEELDMAVRMFQNTMMRIRYSSVPVIAAPHNLTLGGACELCMHSDKVVAHAETYMGLVEFGVGVIPAGGGTKEFALRLSDELKEGDVELNRFRQRFLTIGQAKVSTSAYEAFDLGYLRPGLDEVIVSRDHQLQYAKQSALLMWEKGYVKPQPRKDIKVLGQEALGLVYVGANSMLAGNYITEYEQEMSKKLGWILAGGDLSSPTQVSEQYLLDLERKVFVELCMNKKTLERMQSLITTGKVLRN